MNKWQKIDIALIEAMDKGYEAAKIGESKFANDYEPGSLSFDVWAESWKKYHSDVFGLIEKNSPVRREVKGE